MTVSEIIKNLSPAARTSLAEVPGYPVKVGAVPRAAAGGRETLQAMGVLGPGGGLTIKGAAVVDRIKAESEPF